MESSTWNSEWPENYADSREIIFTCKVIRTKFNNTIIDSYEIKFTKWFKNNWEVLELFNFLSNNWCTWAISCDWLIVNTENPERAVWKNTLLVDWKTYSLIERFFLKNYVNSFTWYCLLVSWVSNWTAWRITLILRAPEGNKI